MLSYQRPMRKETQQDRERSMFGVRPGKRRKRRITSSKTETESTNDRSFTSCWSIHASPVPKAKQPCDAACACSLPSSKGLASCACICSCRPAGASSRPVHALDLPRSRSSFNERVRACMRQCPHGHAGRQHGNTYGFGEMRAFAGPCMRRRHAGTDVMHG